MANYGKYYIAVRLLLLKQYLEANAGRNRIVKRRELEDLLAEHDMPVHLRHRLPIVCNSRDFSAHNQTASLLQKVAERDAV